MSTNFHHIADTLALVVPSPIHQIESQFLLQNQNISVFCKRDDLIHPTISGNKWRKLAPTINAITSNEEPNPTHILSFGGGYSNHLHALGYICHRLKIRFTAVVRGDYSHSLSPMLNDLKQWGAHCHFVNKAEYKARTTQSTINKLQWLFSPDIIIPEGGSSRYCLAGVAALVDEYQAQLDNITHVVLPVASGGTLAGLIQRYAQLEQLNSESEQTALVPPDIIGVGVLKGETYLESLVYDLLKPVETCTSVSTNINSPFAETLSYPKWHIEHDFHHGGYAKSSPELSQFIDNFESNTHIPIETVYSAKCFFALHALIKKQHFAKHSRILIVHTGGLQGSRRA